MASDLQDCGIEVAELGSFNLPPHNPSHSPPLPVTDIEPGEEHTNGPVDDPTVSVDDMDDEEEDVDIYRGEPPVRPPSQRTVSSSSLSSSTSSSLFTGVRGLGAIAHIVEHAISRWARGIRSSSTTSGSSSSVSSLSLSPSRPSTRRRRGFSVGSLHAEVSELDFTARITLIKAREESRQAPRQFVLYLPSSLMGVSANGLIGGKSAVRSTSLSAILSRLDVVLKQSAKARRSQERKLKAATVPESGGGVRPSHFHHDFMLPESMKVPSRAASFTDIRNEAEMKGKSKETVPSSAPSELPEGWFLDVSSPTASDMHAIGKLLHLHPLTLEDIIQRDPREKLELFPKLGYYFISFRAVRSHTIKQTGYRGNRGTVNVLDDLYEEGLLGEANIYLVVFREGICSFHFANISEHTDRILNRIVQLDSANVTSMTSDWIAHGILDSVVDSFFPLLSEIEKEVLIIEDLVSSGHGLAMISRGGDDFSITVTPEDDGQKEPRPRQSLDEKISPSLSTVDKEITYAVQSKLKTRFALSLTPVPLLLRRIKRSIKQHWKDATKTERLASSTRNTVLRQMARTRRLVTSLNRLLAPKSDVVAQLRKRALTGMNGESKGHDFEVAMYLGDIQDHILTLQHSLAHYERMLSETHPIYLSQLRAAVAATKAGSDKAILYLTIVSVGALSSGPLIGLFSLNVTVPHNGLDPGSPYNIFGAIIAGVVLIFLLLFALIQRWWSQAKRKRGSRL